jgi:hypothetical protein
MNKTRIELINKIRAYINHAERVQNGSKFKNEKTLGEITILKIIFSEIKDKGLQTINKMIRANYEKLQMILPHPLNKSYDSSLKNLSKLLEY